MSDPYLIVLWCADTSRLASFAGAHLLDEGLQTVNHGRIAGDVPVAVGVANLRRWPIISREVAAAGLLRSRRPSVRVAERHDFLLTFTSGSLVDATAPVHAIAQSRVIAADELLGVVQSTSPNSMTKTEVLNLFASAARPAIMSGERRKSDTDLGRVADTCQRLITALAS
jgi:hypothetical protein